MLQGNTTREEETRAKNLFASGNARGIAWKRRENRMCLIDAKHWRQEKANWVAQDERHREL